MISRLNSQDSVGGVGEKISRLKVYGEGIRPTTVLDKFLLVAIGVGCAAGLLLGLSMWLRRFGYLSPTEEFFRYRTLHAVLGMHVFFGIAITGFVVQAAPRLFGIGLAFSRIAVWLIVLGPLAGLLSVYLGFSQWMTTISLALGPLTTAVVLISRQGIRSSRPHSLFILTSMLAFVVSGYLTLNDVSYALALFWVAVGGALCGTSHLFVVNLLGGRHLGGKTLYAVWALLAGSGFCLGFGYLRLGAITALFCLLWYSLGLRIFTVTGGSAVLRLAFKAGFAWALSAWTLLIFQPWRVDQSLHLLALGWGIPILFALSLHITAVLGGLDPKPTRLSKILLCCWQLVPIMRGLLFDTRFAAQGFMPVAVIVILFASYWIFALATRSRAIMNRV